MINLKALKDNAAKYLHLCMMEVQPQDVVEICERAIVAEHCVEIIRQNHQNLINELTKAAREIRELTTKLSEIEKQKPAYMLDYEYEEGHENPDLGGDLIFHQLDGKTYLVGTEFYAGPVQPSPVVAVPEAINLLGMLFDLYENGIDCYENPEDMSNYIGKAFKIDDETFHACVSILNGGISNQSLSTPTPSAEQSTELNNCTECGSGDVSFCCISVRPHCNECKHWAPINHGTKQEAIDKWNAKSEQPDSAAPEQDLFERERLAIKFCEQYMITEDTERYRDSALAFSVGFDVARTHYKPQRITEQDVLTVLKSFYNWSYALGWSADGDQYLNDEGRTLLAKLNENRENEPDYKAQRDLLLTATKNYLLDIGSKENEPVQEHIQRSYKLIAAMHHAIAQCEGEYP